jgi:hypothetical protein
LLIDAAQLSINAMPWKTLIEGDTVHNLLWDQPEATHPEVCPLLADYSAPWVDAFVGRYLPRRPFAFTALISNLSQHELAQALNLRTSIHVDGVGKGLLRFYDATVLPSVLRAFDTFKADALLSPAWVWLYVERDGQLCEARPRSKAARLMRWSVTVQEQLALRQDGLTDRVGADLKANGHIPVSVDPIATYQQVRQILSSLRPDSANNEALLYRVCAVLLTAPAIELAVPVLGELLSRHWGSLDELDEALWAWREEASALTKF